MDDKSRAENFAIVLAGGQGSRLGAETPKQFLNLRDKPVIVWSIEAFIKAGIFTEIIVVVPAAHREMMREVLDRYGLSSVKSIVDGGATRQGSAYNALTSRKFHSDDILLFHDAARPFISTAVIANCVEAAKLYGAAGAYVKAIDTIAEADSGFVRSIPPRDVLYYTQTPQSFKYEIIMAGHEKALAQGSTGSTDDVKLVLDCGHDVKIVEGDYTNIKITTPFDLEMAEYLAKRL